LLQAKSANESNAPGPGDSVPLRIPRLHEEIRVH